MKETLYKSGSALLLTPLFAYFGKLGLPLVLLFAVIVCDYLSGLGAAWSTRTLSSRIGILGIVKKVCYLLMVAVGVIIDLILQNGLSDVLPSLFGADSHPVALLVIVWLIVNECLSILENLSEIGIPLPGFLARIVTKLKHGLEEAADRAKEDGHDRADQ